MKELLFVLCTLLAVYSAYTASINIAAEPQDTRPFLGEEKCTWGPSYWCKNLENAKECNAFKYCTERVWNKMEVQ